MAEINRDVTDYIAVCVSEFAERYSLSMSDAYRYLRDGKGIDFLINFYEAEHILSFYDVVDDLTLICKRICESTEEFKEKAKGAWGASVANIQLELMDYNAQDMIVFLMEDYGLDIGAAMDVLYTSRTFEGLTNINTDFYLQGSSYIYELLKREPGLEDKCKGNT